MKRTQPKPYQALGNTLFHMVIIEDELAKEAATLLAPFLSRLMGTAGTEAIKVAAKKAGEAAWDRADRLWDKLQPQLEEEPEVAKTFQEIAEAGDDQKEAEAVILPYIKKIIKDMSPEELAAIRNIVAGSKSETRISIVYGDQSVSISGDVSSTSIITVDRSKTKLPR